jgi:hypothetical protein
MARANSNLPHWRTLSIVVVNPFVPLLLDPVNKEPNWPSGWRILLLSSLEITVDLKDVAAASCPVMSGMCRNQEILTVAGALDFNGLRGEEIPVRMSAMVESGCGAVAVGQACLLPPLSSGGALVARP